MKEEGLNIGVLVSVFSVVMLVALAVTALIYSSEIVDQVMASNDKAEVGDTTSLSFNVKTADGHYVQVNGTAVMEKDISIDYDFLKGLELKGDFKISAVKAFIMAETRMAALEDTREDLKPSNLENWTAIRLGRHGKGITFAITSFGDKSVAKVKQDIAIARHRHQAHFRSQPGIPFF